MKEGVMQFFAAIGSVATIIGFAYGVCKFGDFISEIYTRVRLLEEDIKKLRELVLLTKDEEK